jgi:hypothetical protein
MSKIASILACCAAASMFSLAAQALPGSPAPTQIAVSEVTLVGGSCGLGFHYSRHRGCIANSEPYEGPQAFSFPYVELPHVRLPYVEPPPYGVPYVELPHVRLPYVEPPTGGIAYVELPPVRVPYVEPPPYGVPYVELPRVRIPYPY